MVQRAIGGICKAKLKLIVITDVCLCEYTDHGHCGVIENGEVANDATLTILAQQALSHARAGADIVEVDGSHLIMVSQPQVVTDHILKALRSVG